jgi:hypothetical protein
MRLFAQRHWGMGMLIAVAAALAFPASWSAQLADLGGDSATYVLMARHYTSWFMPDALAGAFARESQFPPLYPLLLAGTGGGLDLRLAHAVTVACLLAALIALYAYALVLGLSRSVAVALVALFAMMPGTLAPALTIKSEPLYLALTLGGFALLGTAAHGNARRHWAASALFAAAVLARSVGVVLAPALALAVWRRRAAHWPWMVLVMMLPGLAWIALRSGQAYGSTYSGYGEATLAGLSGQVLFNIQAFAWGLAGNLLQTGALLPWMVALATVAAIVLCYRFARLEADAWYVAGYLAVMAVWPYPSEAQRFAWVVMPWLLLYCALGASAVAGLLAQHRAAAAGVRWAVPAIVALLVLPSFVVTVQRWWEPSERALAHLPEWYLPDRTGAEQRARQHLDIARGIATLGRQVPAGDCVYSIRPSVVAVFTGLDGYLAPLEAVGDAAFDHHLAERPCRYFMLLEAIDGDAYRTLFYPRDRLGDRLEVVDVYTSSLEGATRIVVALARLRG